ncbi:hypothetical protein B296_00050486 [Ensete ventricosum]|uniref:Retrotransposon gag domain-containing protein n=1 Tax=Ensete ventricosum TaxID=4639 RepID=A0A426YKZ9_ENSVE|nr:hypothetical protein B296_00050486 [Ensete ventricosum]
MSQERSTSVNPGEDVPPATQPTSRKTLRPSLALPSFGDRNIPSHTQGQYWSLLNDPRLTPPPPNPRIPVVTPKTFQGLTNQRIDDVRRTIGTKDEHSEGPLRGSPFVQEIQDAPIPLHFRLPILEAYDGSSDPTEHVVAFHTQMTLYGTSDAIMCRAFPTTLRRIARGWYSRLPPSSIHSFDQLTREFEANFPFSARPKPIVVSLLGMRQKEEEHLGQYLACFTDEVRAILDAHPSLVIQVFMIGIRPSRFFWSLVE